MSDTSYDYDYEASDGNPAGHDADNEFEPEMDADEEHLHHQGEIQDELDQIVANLRDQYLDDDVDFVVETAIDVEDEPDNEYDDETAIDDEDEPDIDYDDELDYDYEPENDYEVELDNDYEPGHDDENDYHIDSEPYEDCDPFDEPDDYDSDHAHRCPSPPAPPAAPPPDPMHPDSTCAICLHALSDTVLIPCGHLVTCSDCCDRLGVKKRGEAGAGRVRCPMCRAFVTDRLLVFRG